MRIMYSIIEPKLPKLVHAAFWRLQNVLAPELALSMRIETYIFTQDPVPKNIRDLRTAMEKFRSKMPERFSGSTL